MSTVPIGIVTLTATMTEEQQAVFYAQLSVVEKDEVAGVLLALFLGSFGAHHFYLRRTGLGVLYLVFCWTFIPGVISLFECFFMPSRVQRYNQEQAAILAASIRGVSPQLFLQPQFSRHCFACGAAVAEGVRFCARCGATVS